MPLSKSEYKRTIDTCREVATNLWTEVTDEDAMNDRKSVRNKYTVL